MPRPHTGTLLALGVLLLALMILLADQKRTPDRDGPPKVAVNLVGKLNIDYMPGPLGLTVVGNYAYLSLWDRGLSVVDVSNPATPKRVGSCRFPGSARDIVVSGNYAYVSAQEGGLRVVDISNPQALTEVGTYQPRLIVREGGQWGPVVEGVAVAENYAYVTYNYVPKGKNAWTSILQVLDVSNPKTPVERGSFEAAQSGLFLGVAVAGNYAYVADKDGRLWVVDVSDPKAPAEAGSCDAIGEPQGVVLAGNYAYVADDDGAMRIVDISNPNAPKIVGSYLGAVDRPGIAESVAVTGKYAYVCDHITSRLWVVDISDPKVPRDVASYAMPGSAGGVIVAGGYVYVNVWRGGLFILKVAGHAV